MHAHTHKKKQAHFHAHTLCLILGTYEQFYNYFHHATYQIMITNCWDTRSPDNPLGPYEQSPNLTPDHIQRSLSSIRSGQI